MIISTKKGTPKEELEKIVDKFEHQGLDVTLITGKDYNVFGLVGDTTKIDERDVLANPWIDNVTRVSAPYKRANRLFHPADSVIDCGGVRIGGREKIAVMAGPCSIESEEQALRIAQSVKAGGAALFRGGAYKPRTSPYAYQGMGPAGLDLLCEASAELDMPIVTEIMSEKHLDLFADVDIIQLGRTLNNIFSFRLDFFNIFDFILIVFVANLTYDLFQQVFQCDQTRCGTVFVQNDCQIDGCFTHFDHQVCCSFVFIGKIRLTQDVAD